jgi:hypothetical protein
MAATSASPYSPDADFISLVDASALFAETGHPVSSSDLKKLAVKSGVRVKKVGRDNIASWSDLLEVHAEEVDRREGRRARE